MLNRRELAKYFAKKGFTKGAEVGVHAGYYSRVLLDFIPGLTLYMVDSWSLHEGRRRAYEEVMEIFPKLYPNAIICKGDSISLAETIPDESLDFVFIDADHSYQAVKKDIEAWFPKVKKGGIVSGHDYYQSRSGQLGVIKAVDEFVAKHKYTLQLTEWDKHAPHTDNKQPCWYFEK
jgi:predicted O-methyltransferase YrrM